MSCLFLPVFAPVLSVCASARVALTPAQASLVSTSRVHSPLQFRVLSDSVSYGAEGALTATLHAAVAGAPHFALSIQAYDSGAARVRILEKTDMTPRWEVRH